ncbi:MAG: IS1634 family transposase [Bacteroidia bacterium]|nr:IS1634 family transposase [Bacteroidia bacterium]
MLRIREVKTGSGGIAVQVICYQNRKRIIVEHIGTAHKDEDLEQLLHLAAEFIKENSNQLSLFSNVAPNSMLFVGQCQCVGVYYTLLYSTLARIQKQIGLHELSSQLLNDLVTIRIMEPASKLRSIELLETYFGIKHRRQNFYKDAPQWLHLKSVVESNVMAFAQRNYNFSYNLLFYDVTTLYFETFEDDELRKQGFSKDNKSQQPQILVALMVSQEGFPIAYEIFSGNTFEGHTIIPVVKDFIHKNKVETFTIIADAAMISIANINELLKAKIHYIVGARLGNLSEETIAEIDQKLIREDGKSIRLKTDNGYLICFTHPLDTERINMRWKSK